MSTAEFTDPLVNQDTQLSAAIGKLVSASQKTVHGTLIEQLAKGVVEEAGGIGNAATFCWDHIKTVAENQRGKQGALRAVSTLVKMMDAASRAEIDQMDLSGMDDEELVMLRKRLELQKLLQENLPEIVDYLRQQGLTVIDDPQNELIANVTQPTE